MLLFFYDSTQNVTDDQREEIDAVVEENRGLIDLVAYDIGKYTTVDSDGDVTVDDGARRTTPSAQQAVSSPAQLGVELTPYIVIVDDQGYIIWQFAGFVDRELLEREVQRATE